MKKLALFCLCGFIFAASIALNAQKPQLNFSSVYSVEQLEQPVKVRLISNEPNSHYVVSSAYMSKNMKTVAIVQKFNKDNQRVYSSTLLPDVDYFFEGIEVVSGHVYWFTSKRDKEKKIKYLYAQELDANGSPASERKQLLSYTAEKWTNEGYISVAVSPNQKNIIVMVELPKKKDVNEELMMYGFDVSLTKLWEQANNLEYMGNLVGYNTLLASNNGKPYILKQTGKKRDTYSIISFDKQGKLVKENKIDLGVQKKVLSTLTAFDANNDLIIAGYYWEGKETAISVSAGTPNHGNYILRVDDASGLVKTTNTNAFAETIKNLQPKHLFLTADNIILVGDESWKVTYSVPVAAGAEPKFSDTYYADNIYVDVLDLNGKQVRTSKIKKGNRADNDGGNHVGFFCGMMGNTLGFVFNDDWAVHDVKKHTIVVGNNYDVPVFCSVNLTTGAVTTTIAIADDVTIRPAMQMTPGKFLQTEDGKKFVVVAEEGASIKLGYIVWP